MVNAFKTCKPNILGNPKIRAPQQGAYEALAAFAVTAGPEREVGIVLPVGCGKSGCIALAPFAFQVTRVLVIAPSVPIADQLARDFDPANTEMFYQKCSVLPGAPYPEPVEIRGTTSNLSDLDEAQVVITNIHQLQGEGNRWLDSLPPDYFDLILFDEGHHSVANSWEVLKAHFPGAYIVNFSATPLRADGQLMAGRVLYSFPVARAIEDGYVKRLKAVQLNPRTLRYVRRDSGREIEVSLDEVRRLGEVDADFRRSIVTSTETVNTIVDASIRELERLRIVTGEKRLKIIASALNFQHCTQIVEAYRARGRRADYVHSKEDGAANKRVMVRLENHDLDVIVQVRKLGEGFDHRFLSVAAVFSIFSNLSPFVQFVGRVMRVIVQDAPGHSLNQGVVVFHAGANVARQWSDFQRYSEADQEYFDQLLPLEYIEPVAPETDVNSAPRGPIDVEVRAQTDVQLEEIPLTNDAAAAIRLLQEQGIIPSDFDPARQTLQPVPTTKARERQAKRASLDPRVKTEATRILKERGMNPAGHELDRQRLGRDNFVVLKTAIDRQVSRLLGRGSGERHDFSRAELDRIEEQFDPLLQEAMKEVFNGTL